ncbi:SIS domain-containing protein [Candidatus Neomarinimicrobiota bacterium]
MSITIKEILSQPKTWQSVLDKKNTNIDNIRNDLIGKTNVFIGSGTSYYLSMSASNIFSKYTKQNAIAVPSAEVFLYPDIIFPKTSNEYSSFLISRSGTTTEVLLAGDVVDKKMGIITSSVTCRKGSGLTNYGKYQFLLDEADEKSVVMTRSFTSMLFQIQLLADSISGGYNYKNLAMVPEFGDALVKQNQSIVKDIINTNNIESFVFLGHGPLFGIANEAMLKVTEMSISISNEYHGLEFRHGPMSRVNESTLITFFIGNDTMEREKSLVNEMHALGAKTLVVCDKAVKEIRNTADYIIELGTGMKNFENLILHAPIAQYMGYYQALKKGLNPDTPQNLTQVVTL